ncbi:MAG: FUSC family protein [Comamonadaceae bacterium]|nr:FUSC family protein [Burkholderiales bacterium]MEB2347721.1 FUSC family protein [Comamonadaceae bacterium]
MHPSRPRLAALWQPGSRAHGAWRMLLGSHALLGASAALGMLLATALAHAAFGPEAAIHASVGALITLVPHGMRARRGTLVHLIVAPLLGLPLFWAVQMLRERPLALGAVLVAATFVSFLIMAWGKRGVPVAAAIMLAALLAMAPLPVRDAHEALVRTAYGALGALTYLVYGVVAQTLLNTRHRTQLVAELLMSVAALLRTQARRVCGGGPAPDAPRAWGALLRDHAALADELQAARDVVLEAPRTARRQRLAGMLIVVLEMRDRLIASELDLERVRASDAPQLREMADILRSMARDVDALADALLAARLPPPAHPHDDRIARLRAQAQDDAREHPGAQAFTQAAVVRSIATRVGDQDGAVRQLVALARGELAPDLSAVRAGWQLFVSPAYWSLQPLLTLWHWRQPALRTAVRAALAVGAGYGLAMLLPWASRDYWILITVVSVLRGNLAQTLQRRDARVIGTVVGSLLAAALLALHPSTAALLFVVIASQGVAQAFAVRNYTVLAIAVSILSLVQTHLLHAETSMTFALLERVGDTLLGAGIAWAFSYVLPSWERERLAALVQRVGRALAGHARHSLALATLDEITAKPELAWRLARREAYDALSALAQATGRALAEPRAVQPPLAVLERLQGQGYQLLGQLSAIQSMLLLRRDRLQVHEIAEPIAEAAARITAALEGGPPPAVETGGAGADEEARLAAVPEALPSPFETDATPWLRRRLALAVELAGAVRITSAQVVQALHT